MTDEAVPFHFGSTAAPLFGILHRASPDGPTAAAAVLCPALDAEHSRGHRALLLLARRLADAGRPALRFDPTGCGDSFDDERAGILARWRDDVDRAIDEARGLTGAAGVDLVGVRFGATLAAAAAFARDDVRSLVLWDPLESGSAWLDQLSAAHAELAASLPAGNAVGGPGEGEVELLGFRYPRALREELASPGARIPPPASPSARAPRTLVVETGEESRASTLMAGLTERGVHVDHELAPGPRVWSADERAALVPAGAVRAIQTWLLQEAAG